ncbi:hypothetical protein F2Q69_00008333 [Brassica cretica]|uniref:Uncharacterized protein n=1 Tax=Brassica cretica TaxID=69181 RepID=A0A8S9NXK1_BRACR|nr:hypothetical protein F2Q69_00008333 [Brassica cretica]
MPPGAKKRKALKKKQQQQQAIGTSTNNDNGDNLHGNEEHGSQDDRESDSNLSSPGSQGNQEFGGMKDPSAATVKDAAKEISEANQGLGTNSVNVIAFERGTDVEKSPISSYENSTQTAKTVASQEPVSKVVVSEESEHAETSNLVKHKSGAGENGKVASLPGSASGTSKMVENARESEVPLSPEEKRLLLPGPSAVRTSWLSCCGLFDAMTGSDR